ncbi:MAG: RecX family transcriptional regulator [Thermotaleaceae bacterium]
MDFFQEGYVHALKYLTLKARTERELVDYLKKKGFTEETIIDIIGRLKSLNYVNDYEYARQYIELTGTNKSMSLEMMKIKLLQRGISLEVIKQALKDSSTEELGHCITILRKKLKDKEYLLDNQQRIKVKSYLYRKGFTSETIHRALEAIFDE